MKRIALALAVGLALAGCSSDKNSGPTLVSQDKANALGAQQSNFDGPEPKITAQTRYAAGQLAEAQNLPARAIEQYQMALKLDPKHEPSMYRLALMFTAVKEYPQAIKTWQNYIKLTKESATAYNNLALTQELAGQFDAAEASYLKGIEKDPKNASCRVNYGLMLARHDKVAQAREQLSEVLAPAEVHYNLGSIFELRGFKNKAREEYAQALAIDKDLKDAKKRMAFLDQN